MYQLSDQSTLKTDKLRTFYICVVDLQDINITCVSQQYTQNKIKKNKV